MNKPTAISSIGIIKADKNNNILINKEPKRKQTVPNIDKKKETIKAKIINSINVGVSLSLRI